jgi:hypothetical protein
LAFLSAVLQIQWHETHGRTLEMWEGKSPPRSTVLANQLGAVEKRGSPVWRGSWLYRLAEKRRLELSFCFENGQTIGTKSLGLMEVYLGESLMHKGKDRCLGRGLLTF